MRILNAIKNDIRFQIKYGFYFLYFFFTVVYIVALRITPSEYKNMAASLIILTDPAMLGVFFMGGIWLLEKGEGLHRFWSISPLRTIEYVWSKSISLSILSTISAILIVLIGIGGRIRFIFLALCIFIGAIVLNLIGLLVASYAHSVNQYMIIVIFPTIVLSLPPVFTAFGITHPFFEIFPGTALWHMIESAFFGEKSINGWIGINLILWFGVLSVVANKRIGVALQSAGGEGV